MKAAFIGGGPGCKALIEMIISKRFQSFPLEVVAVADTNPKSVGYQYADAQGIPVYTDLDSLLRIDGLDIIFELVGKDDVLDRIYQHLPSGVRVIDHFMARVYWELEESQRRFHQIINSAHGIITIKDIRGRYVMVNTRASEFFDVSQSQFVGKTSFELLPDGIASLFFESEKRILDSKEPESLEEVFDFKGMERRWRTERFAIDDYQGKTVGICSISRDVTNEARLRKELIQTVKMATLGQLAAGVAHEINNPLTGILSFAESIQLSLDPSNEQYEEMNIIIKETLRCRRIVRDLLDYSRLSTPDTEMMSMDAAIKRVLAMVEKQAAFQDIEIAYELKEELPPVQMDPSQAQQVILNLLINAQEAMSSRGRIEINLFNDLHHKCIVTEIADSGCGIPKERMHDIFEPFYSTKGSQGNGLGLPAVLRIIEAHKGHISVDSREGAGTTFRFGIPYASQVTLEEAYHD